MQQQQLEWLQEQVKRRGQNLRANHMLPHPSTHTATLTQLVQPPQRAVAQRQYPWEPHPGMLAATRQHVRELAGTRSPQVQQPANGGARTLPVVHSKSQPGVRVEATSATAAHTLPDTPVDLPAKVMALEQQAALLDQHVTALGHTLARQSAMLRQNQAALVRAQQVARHARDAHTHLRDLLAGIRSAVVTRDMDWKALQPRLRHLHNDTKHLNCQLQQIHKTLTTPPRGNRKGGMVMIERKALDAIWDRAVRIRALGIALKQQIGLLPERHKNPALCWVMRTVERGSNVLRGR